MRLSALLAFSLLLACKSQQPPVAPAEPAPTRASSEEDEWNGFGGNDHPDEPSAEGQQVAAHPDGGVDRACTKMLGFSGMERLEGAAKAEFKEVCHAQLEGIRSIDPQGFSLVVECIEAASSMDEMQACAEEEDGEAAEPQPTAEVEDVVLQLCRKMARLAENEPNLPEESKTETADIDACVLRGRVQQQADPEEFDLLAACVLRPEVSTLQGVINCALEVAQL